MLSVNTLNTEKARGRFSQLSDVFKFLNDFCFKRVKVIKVSSSRGGSLGESFGERVTCYSNIPKSFNKI